MHKSVRRAEWILHLALENRNKPLLEDFLVSSPPMKSNLQEFTKICRWCDNRFGSNGWKSRFIAWLDHTHQHVEISWRFKTQENLVEFLLSWG